jgi:hypothetical protein
MHVKRCVVGDRLDGEEETNHAHETTTTPARQRAQTSSPTIQTLAHRD